MKQLSNRLTEEARAVGVRNFLALFNEYLAAVKDAGSAAVGDNATDFDGQEMSLWCGSWQADDGGIRGTDRFGFEITACSHPILPVRRLKNVDTGLEKIELAFRRGRGGWERRIFDKSAISDARSIIRLADYGVDVSSDSAKHLVRYLSEVESLNYDVLPSTSSVGRLGWIDGYGFSPYDRDLVFDGQEDFRDYFESVRERGSYEAWMEAVRSIRAADGPVARILLAASFASVLVRPCGALPFLLHLWGGSEVGKTVGLMLAASVWSDPEMGRYIKSFNATGVGKELGAAFFNSLPMLLDELQIIDGTPANRVKFQQMIYELAEGVGRVRGKKSGGLQKTGTWRNCIMSTGEHPLIDSATAAGAANRIIEIDCEDVHLFARSGLGGGKGVASFLQRNYGFSGRRFVEKLQEGDNLTRAAALHDRYIEEIAKSGDVTDKQSASAALILTADHLAEEWLFQDGVRLRAKDLAPFLVTKARMDQNRRALEFLHDQVAMNPGRFRPDLAVEKSTELWGDMDERYIYIIKPQFDRLLGENGFNAASFLGWARRYGAIRVGKDGKNAPKHRILGKDTRCVWLAVGSDPGQLEDGGDGEDELPL